MQSTTERRCPTPGKGRGEYCKRNREARNGTCPDPASVKHILTNSGLLNAEKDTVFSNGAFVEYEIRTEMPVVKIAPDAPHISSRDPLESHFVNTFWFCPGHVFCCGALPCLFFY